MNEFFLLVAGLGLVLVSVFGMGGASGISLTGEDFEIYIDNFSADKELYHSAEIMNLSVIVYSDSDLENVSVSAEGVSGRLNEEKVLNLNKGLNEVSFSYQLPKCNVCGGIRAGEYSLECEVNYGNFTAESSLMINIQQ